MTATIAWWVATVLPPYRVVAGVVKAWAEVEAKRCAAAKGQQLGRANGLRGPPVAQSRRKQRSYSTAGFKAVVAGTACCACRAGNECFGSCGP